LGFEQEGGRAEGFFGFGRRTIRNETELIPFLRFRLPVKKSDPSGWFSD
jgi:hypothetical protein